MEKGNFEKAWKDAFDGAEVTPSNSVWTNVELELEKSAGGKMKQRLLFYKVLAAASLVFAMGIGGAYYVSVQADYNQTTGSLSVNPDASIKSEINDTQTQIEQHIDNNQEQKASENDRVVNSGNNTSSSLNTLRLQDRNLTSVDKGFSASRNQVEEGETINTSLTGTMPTHDQGLIVSREEDFYNRVTDRFVNRPLPPLANTSKPKLIITEPYTEPDPGMVLLAKLKDEEEKYAAMDKRKSTENIWTSIGVGAGSFNPNTTSSVSVNNNLSSGNNQNPTANAGPSAGSSYSMGLQIGGRIADRFMLLGGLSYLTQNASYTSTVVSMESANRAASLNDFSNTQSASYASTPYGVNSNLQFVSLPVQAGYLIIDKDFSIQLNGGVSTDFFIVNTLTPDVSGISKITQSAGADSPYRTINFSGLAGTEFSYRFSDHYRIAINPGMRYALNSIYKSDSNAEVAPITFDVALRFRYIFR
ncbi:MAG: hypothetical protein KF846_01000 [Cyclobacteriaceae bacterium]|nr:hypothetical protein [Cyclobacteriaceae bacterium]